MSNKNFYDEDEEISDSNSADEDYDEEQDELNISSVTSVKQKNHIPDFDEKVAKTVTKIHKDVQKKEANKKFSKWVNENYDHLKNLYQLSETTLSEQDFYTFVYDHSF